MPQIEVEVINEGTLNIRKAVIGTGHTPPLAVLVEEFDTPIRVTVNLVYQSKKARIPLPSPPLPF
jgi:hypothetical protein